MYEIAIPYLIFRATLSIEDDAEIHRQDLLDLALDQTFPASDPVPAQNFR